MAHRDPRPSHSRPPKSSVPLTDRSSNGSPSGEAARRAAEPAGDFLGLDSEVRGRGAAPSSPNSYASLPQYPQRAPSPYPHAQPMPQNAPMSAQPLQQTQFHAPMPHAHPQAHSQQYPQQHAQSHAPSPRQGPQPVPLAPAPQRSHPDSASALQWLDDASTAVLEETRFRAQGFQAPPAPSYTPYAAPQSPISAPTASQQHTHGHPAPQPSAFQAPYAPSAHAPRAGAASPSALMQPNVGDIAPAPAVNPNSWLLELDDARAGRAGMGPVVGDPSRALAAPRPPTLLEASFAEAPPVVERTMPWIVRGLIACAAVSFVLVVGYTVTRPRMTTAKPQETPQPVAVRNTSTPVQLENPNAGRTSVARGDRGRAGNSTGNDGADTDTTSSIQRVPIDTNAATRAQQPPRGATHVPRPTTNVAGNSNTNSVPVRPLLPEAPPVQIEIPPAEFAPTLRPPTPVNMQENTPQNGVDGSAATPGSVRLDVRGSSATSAHANAANGSLAAAGVIPEPSWFPGAQRTTPLAISELGPGPNELAASPDRRERVDRWLMVQSRSAAPAFDTSSVYVPPAKANSPSNSPVPSRDGGAILAAASAREPSASIRVEPTDADKDASPRATTPVANATSTVRWEGAVVPVDQIESKSRILTPKVGRVRVELEGGDSMEGVLYAVGEGRVWLDAEGGRIALPREQIERLEQIATPPSSPSTVAVVPEPPATDARAATTNATTNSTGAAKTEVAKTDAGKTDATRVIDPAARVRVRTPGGLFYGRIVSREGDTLTLITDEGARVTVDSTDVEAAPERKTLVKRPAPKPAKKPAGKPEPPVPADGAEDGSHPDSPH